jgi:uncharacterized protein
MKSIFFIIIFLVGILSKAQVDTMTWDYTKRQIPNQEYADGYHIFKKNGIKVLEFKRQNGKSTGVTKEYYDNGNLKLEYEIKHLDWINYFSGPYNEYYESGKPKIQGTYKFSDSITCVNCYDLDKNKIVTKASSHSDRTGSWKEFHENGQLKSIGIYKGIHETNEIHFHKPKNGEWTPGEYSEEYMKDKLWVYYDDEGRVIKEEFYLNGVLADIKTYDH